MMMCCGLCVICSANRVGKSDLSELSALTPQAPRFETELLCFLFAKKGPTCSSSVGAATRRALNSLSS